MDLFAELMQLAAALDAAPSPSPAALEARLRAAAAMSDLDPARRLDGKLDLSPAGIERRLREAAALLEACERLAALGLR